jgi:hypothetical protein
LHFANIGGIVSPRRKGRKNCKEGSLRFLGGSLRLCEKILAVLNSSQLADARGSMALSPN